MRQAILAVLAQMVFGFETASLWNSNGTSYLYLVEV